jgi:endonuclease/exonuclease/phosphatase (EEP) superfamily protein YafD
MFKLLGAIEDIMTSPHQSGYSASMSTPEQSEIPPIKRRPKRTAGESFAMFSKFGIFLIALATPTPYLGTLHWVIELFSHFFHWYFLLGLISCLVLFITRNRRWAVAGLFVAAANSLLLVPIYLSPTSSDAEPNLRILHANVLTTNTDHQSFLELVEDVNPDIISVQENNLAWQEALRALGETYPHAKILPREDNFGIALYSRLPFEEIEVLIMTTARVPAIEASVSVAGRSVKIFAIHTLPPLDGFNARSRAAQLAQIPKRMPAAGTPTLLIGDLNTTMTSPLYRRLEEASGLRNARYGFAFGATCPRPYGALGLPLDHVLVSGDIEVKSFRVGPDIGSDHLPIVVEVYVPPTLD